MMRNILYVSNVSQSADLGMMEELFLSVGDVMSQYMEVIPESGRSMGFGIFEMRTEQQAADCVQRFHGQTIKGKQLSIVSERPKSRPVAVPVTKSRRTSGKRTM